MSTNNKPVEHFGQSAVYLISKNKISTESLLVPINAGSGKSLNTEKTGLKSPVWGVSWSGLESREVLLCIEGDIETYPKNVSAVSLVQQEEGRNLYQLSFNKSKGEILLVGAIQSGCGDVPNSPTQFIPMATQQTKKSYLDHSLLKNGAIILVSLTEDEEAEVPLMKGIDLFKIKPKISYMTESGFDESYKSDLYRRGYPVIGKSSLDIDIAALQFTTDGRASSYQIIITEDDGSSSEIHISQEDLDWLVSNLLKNDKEFLKHFRGYLGKRHFLSLTGRKDYKPDVMLFFRDLYSASASTFREIFNEFLELRVVQQSIPNVINFCGDKNKNSESKRTSEQKTTEDKTSSQASRSSSASGSPSFSNGDANNSDDDRREDEKRQDNQLKKQCEASPIAESQCSGCGHELDDCVKCKLCNTCSSACKCIKLDPKIEYKLNHENQQQENPEDINFRPWSMVRSNDGKWLLLTVEIPDGSELYVFETNRLTHEWLRYSSDQMAALSASDLKALARYYIQIDGTHADFSADSRLIIVQGQKRTTLYKVGYDELEKILDNDCDGSNTSRFASSIYDGHLHLITICTHNRDISPPSVDHYLINEDSFVEQSSHSFDKRLHVRGITLLESGYIMLSMSTRQDDSFIELLSIRNGGIEYIRRLAVRINPNDGSQLILSHFYVTPDGKNAIVLGLTLKDYKYVKTPSSFLINLESLNDDSDPIITELNVINDALPFNYLHTSSYLANLHGGQFFIVPYESHLHLLNFSPSYLSLISFGDVAQAEDAIINLGVESNPGFSFVTYLDPFLVVASRNDKRLRVIKFEVPLELLPTAHVFSLETWSARAIKTLFKNKEWHVLPKKLWHWFETE